MRPHPPFFNTADLDAFDARTAALEDPRPHPTEPQLAQLGTALMTELLDVLMDTAFEGHLSTICETFIGGLHAGAQRLERDADRRRDALAEQLRDFDGSEVADVELQDAKQQAAATDVAVRAVEIVRDAAATAYATATGEVWSPWRGSTRPGQATAAQIDAETALRARAARQTADTDAGDFVVAFRASPRGDAAEDARRIFDALNWAKAEWPGMSLALTGARGGERLAKRWAQQKGVRIVLARPNFERHGRAAPFRANEALMQLDPVCVLTLAHSLNAERADARGAFGPALNLAQRAQAAGVQALRILAKRAPA